MLQPCWNLKWCLTPLILLLNNWNWSNYCPSLRGTFIIDWRLLLQVVKRDSRKKTKKIKVPTQGRWTCTDNGKQIYRKIIHLYTWPIRGRRRAEWRTHAAAQAIILAISLSLYSLPSRGSTKASWLPSSNAFVIKGLACRGGNNEIIQAIYINKIEEMNACLERIHEGFII